MKIDCIPSSQSQYHPSRGKIMVTPSVENVGTCTDMAASGKMGDTNQTECLSTPSLSSGRRSIFGSKWQPEDSTHHKVPSQQSQTMQRSKSPMCVLNHPHFQVYTRSDQSTKYKSEEEGDSSKVGFAESMDRSKGALRQKQLRSSLITPRPYESRPLLLASVWNSLPSVFMDDRSRVPLVPRPTKSEPVFNSTNLKSNLRKGRFSGGASASGDTPSKVTFQALIKVHPFEPPMDRWAESGWSKQFDS